MKTIKKAQWVYRLCFCLVLIIPLSGIICTFTGVPTNIKGFVEYTIAFGAIILAFIVLKLTDGCYDYLRKQANELPKEDFINLLKESGLSYSVTDTNVDIRINVRNETIFLDSLNKAETSDVTQGGN